MSFFIEPSTSNLNLVCEIPDLTVEENNEETLQSPTEIINQKEENKEMKQMNENPVVRRNILG